MGGKGSGGSNRKTAEQKARIGNPGHATPKNRMASVTSLPVPVSEAPEPARPLGKAGRELWDRIWLACAAWLKVDADAEHILLLCEMTDERAQLRYMVMSNPDEHRDRKALRDLDKQIMSGLALLGMNPIDRNRLVIGEVKENPFAKLNAEIAAKRAAAKP
jgi:hypothetical protein